MSDKFKELWEDQRSFRELLVRERGFPVFPVDLTSKQGQQLVRDVSHHCHDELWEASLHLKNAKSHRKTEVREIDREAFKEELIDALHLWIEICIVSGLSLEEVCDAYLEKGRKNRERIAGGY